MPNNRDINGFLRGWKPALYIVDTRNLTKKYPELFDYPHIEQKKKIKQKVYDSYLFFQSEERKKQYIDQIRDCSTRMEKDMVFGLTLGFPPKAVVWFAHTDPLLSRSEEEVKERRKRYESERCCITYDGISFASSIFDVEENVKWLWDNIKIPDEYAHLRTTKVSDVVGYEEYETHEGKKCRQTVWKDYDIPYGGEKELQRVAKILQDRR